MFHFGLPGDEFSFDLRGHRMTPKLKGELKVKSLITPIALDDVPMPKSGLTAKVERGRGLLGQIWTATIWRRKKRPIVVVQTSKGKLMEDLGRIDQIYQKA